MANPTTQNALARISKPVTATQKAHASIGTYAGGNSVHQTLAATTIQRIVLTTPAQTFTVFNRTGTNEIYFTYREAGGADPVDPAVGGSGCLVVPAVAGASVTIAASASNGLTVKLISAGAMAYSVEAFA
jgi:hypothetical protein